MLLNSVSLDLSIILADMLLLLPLHCEKCPPTGEEIRVFMQSSGQVSSILFDAAGITARKNDLINHMTTRVTLDCGLQRWKSCFQLTHGENDGKLYHISQPTFVTYDQNAAKKGYPKRILF